MTDHKEHSGQPSETDSRTASTMTNTSSHEPNQSHDLESQTVSQNEQQIEQHRQHRAKHATDETSDEVPLQQVSASGLSSPETPPAPPKMTPTRFMALVSMVFLWTSAQIPTYLWGGIPAIIYNDIGGADHWVWLITGNLLASAAVCPFVGALSDRLGRRPVALLGSLSVVVGQLVCAFARHMDMFIGGMVVTGVGAGLNELTALAGTAEIAPTAQRGKYIALLILGMLPFCPSVLWAQLLAAHAGWRYVGILTAACGFASLVLVAAFYHPPQTAASAISDTTERRPSFWAMDWIGGLLSTAGTVLLVAGLLWGGYPYRWQSTHVLAPLLLGLGLLAAFVVWEAWGIGRVCPDSLPMVPGRLFHKKPHGPPRPHHPHRRLFHIPTLALALAITFVSGANFFSVLMLWPSEAYNVYGHDPIGVGLRGLPFAVGVLVGCFIALAWLTVRRGGNRGLLFVASAVMTAGCAALAAAGPSSSLSSALSSSARQIQQPMDGPLYFVLALAGLGVGGIVVPASLVAAVVCPDDLIATATALTLAIRVAGGAVGYSIYYNVFVQQLVPRLETALAGVLLSFSSSSSSSLSLLPDIIVLTATSQTEEIARLPGIDDGLWRALVVAGQDAFAAAYPFVYYASIAFGAVSMAASLLMDDIGPYMDDHVAVVLG